jgi:hypothetical protein
MIRKSRTSVRTEDVVVCSTEGNNKKKRVALSTPDGVSTSNAW